jgi:hypothetical protein
MSVSAEPPDGSFHPTLPVACSVTDGTGGGGVGVVETLEQRAEAAEQQAVRLRKMVDLARDLGEQGLAELVALIAAEPSVVDGGANGNSHSPKRRVDGPRGREAVRIIVRERPGVWTLKELRAEMETRGWFTSASGLEAAVKRLCSLNGEGKRDGHGRYVFPANHGEEGAIESERSGVAMITSPPE